MSRCFISPGELDQTSCRIPAEEAHHLINVLRLRDGATVTVCDGNGREATAILRVSTQKKVELERTSEILSSIRPKPIIHIYAAVPKGARMDLMIEKCTELGADAIQPLVCERSVRLNNTSTKCSRIERWQRIARMAAAQSSRTWLPEILTPVNLDKSIESSAHFDLRLCAALLPQSQPVCQLAQLHHQINRGICCWIGPEGDFSSAEYSLILKSGITPVNLGPHTLRVETAAIAFTAICRTLWQ